MWTKCCLFSEMTKTELMMLATKAADFVCRNVNGYEMPPRFFPIGSFYRNKPHEYFLKMMRKDGGIMKVYLKDNNGDPRSPINGHINGLFFAASIDPMTGEPPATSPFGSRRLVVASKWLYYTTSNLWFADFYCKRRGKSNKQSPHYITLVSTRPGSNADIFCRENLITVDWLRNPWLRQNPLSSCDWVSAAKGLQVEVLYTENIHVRWLLLGNIGRIYDTPSSGTSTPSGIPKDPDCPTCNIDKL